MPAEIEETKEVKEARWGVGEMLEKEMASIRMAENPTEKEFIERAVIILESAAILCSCKEPCFGWGECSKGKARALLAQWNGKVE